MTRRQTSPEQWLIADQRLDEEFWAALNRLARGSGVLVLCTPGANERRRLRHLAGLRRLTVVTERRRTAARVHNLRELRQALLARAPLILLSPIHETRSHPDWRPLSRMRAATLARLAGLRLVALGGMNERRFRRVQRLGFTGWAGISAFRT